MFADSYLDCNRHLNEGYIRFDHRGHPHHTPQELKMTKYHKNSWNPDPYTIYLCSLCQGATSDKQSMSPRGGPYPTRNWKIITKTAELPPKSYVFFVNRVRVIKWYVSHTFHGWSWPHSNKKYQDILKTIDFPTPKSYAFLLFVSSGINYWCVDNGRRS